MGWDIFLILATYFTPPFWKSHIILKCIFKLKKEEKNVFLSQKTDVHFHYDYKYFHKNFININLYFCLKKILSSILFYFPFVYSLDGHYMGGQQSVSVELGPKIVHLKQSMVWISQSTSVRLKFRFGQIMIWSGDILDWVDFSSVNLGQEVMNNSTLCVRFPPQIQKSNNTS
jgi:hypothetical protein